MSAIAGIAYCDVNRPDIRLLDVERLTTAMQARGPDGLSRWVGDYVGLGLGLLRSTPESVDENAPVVSADGRYVLVWDGRLDNRTEIIEEIGAELNVRNQSDPELLMCAFLTWGEAIVQHLTGDFAFAIWDVQEQTLYCARDQMGARPLYYVCTDSFFAFASDDEALLLLEGVSAQPNEHRIAYALTSSFDDFDYSKSWTESVNSLMPAHTLKVHRGNLSPPKRYWMPPERMLKLNSDAEYDDAFRSIFDEAVRCRMRCLIPPALMLSGGLDSAAIVASLVRLRGSGVEHRIATYSTIHDDVNSCIESQSIMQLVDAMSAEPNYLRVPSVTGALNFADLDAVAHLKPHPVDNSLLLPAMMYLAANRQGHRVMLHATSGDVTTYSRSPYPAYHLRRGHWRTAWGESVAASKNHTQLQRFSAAHIFFMSLLRIGAALTPATLRRCARKFRHSNPSDVGALRNDFVRELQAKIRRTKRNIDSHRSFASASADHRDAIEPRGLVRGLDGHSRLSGKFGMECRDPWADRRVVEFFLALPIEQRVRTGWSKLLARRANCRELPESVLRRTDKHHLGFLFQARLLAEYPAWRIPTTLRALRHLAPYLADSEMSPLMSGSYSQLDPDNTIERLSVALWLERLHSIASSARPNIRRPRSPLTHCSKLDQID